jgi:hypothetical protein
VFPGAAGGGDDRRCEAGCGAATIMSCDPDPAREWRSRGARAFERLDDDHPAAAAWAAARRGNVFGLAVGLAARALEIRADRREQLPRALDVLKANRAGQQAVVADAVEAARQRVQEKAADELSGVVRHRLEPVVALDAVVLPLEGDALFIERDETRIRDGDAMGVAGEIGENGLRPGERPLGVDDPLCAAQRREGGVEGAFVGKGRKVAEEDEASDCVQGREPVEEEAAEEPRQHAHGQEEASLAGDPARSVRRQAAAENDNVDVRMMGQRRVTCLAAYWALIDFANPEQAPKIIESN